ncbi:Ephrin type-A receptor 4-A, partial [Geodia barretti]
AECPEGTFSSGLGNGPCETCPANSEGTGTGLSLCPCLQDYYRAPYEGPSVPCTQSPGRPSDVRVSNVTNTSAVLSWSPPDNGGGRPLYEIGYTVNATGSGGERVVVSGVNDTETIVTGLTPGVLYTFSVSAENDVSSQDNNVNARSLSTTATTLEGVGGTVTEFVVGENGVLSWSSPVPPNGVILYYNVIISTADSGQLVTRVEELDVLTIDVSNYGEMNMDYNVTTILGAGSDSCWRWKFLISSDCVSGGAIGRLWSSSSDCNRDCQFSRSYCHFLFACG